MYGRRLSTRTAPLIVISFGQVGVFLSYFIIQALVIKAGWTKASWYAISPFNEL
jgi:hypothetical protein